VLDIYQEIIKIIESGEGAALVTIIATASSTPRGVATKMLVRPDGSIVGTIGGGSVEGKAIKIAIEVMRTGKPQRQQFGFSPDEEPEMVCGGEMEIFVEPILHTPTIYLFGAGHISFALAKISKMLGFRVFVIDDRKDFAVEERFPDADSIMVEDFENAFSKINIDKRSYIVIATSSHQDDERVLGQAVLTPARYIGMVGSKNKVKTLFDNLSSRGVERQLLEKVHSPIGLEIHAETPEEIAISIMAEIIKVRRSPG
jgi:xanthine dehydrogenase accessory factor